MENVLNISEAARVLWRTSRSVMSCPCPILPSRQIYYEIIPLNILNPGWFIEKFQFSRAIIFVAISTPNSTGRDAFFLASSTSPNNQRFWGAEVPHGCAMLFPNMFAPANGVNNARLRRGRFGKITRHVIGWQCHGMRIIRIAGSNLQIYLLFCFRLKSSVHWKFKHQKYTA